MFSFGPIHLTVNRVTHPVSTEFFALGLSKTMLLSDDPSSMTPLTTWTDKSIVGFHKVIPQLVEIASYNHTTFWVFSHYSVNVGD